MEVICGGTMQMHLMENMKCQKVQASWQFMQAHFGLAVLILEETCMERGRCTVLMEMIFGPDRAIHLMILFLLRFVVNTIKSIKSLEQRWKHLSLAALLHRQSFSGPEMEIRL